MPRAATYEIANYLQAVEQLTTTTLRNVVGGLNLEEALTSRDQINGQLRGVLDEATGNWGIRVSRVELKAIDPPHSIQDSMEKQMRAERDRRAAILTAEGTKQSAILTAEGQRQSAILKAEGDAKAAILRADGEAQAIQKVFDAIHAGNPDQKLLAYQYLQTLPKLAEGVQQALDHPQRGQRGAQGRRRLTGNADARGRHEGSLRATGRDADRSAARAAEVGFVNPGPGPGMMHGGRLLRGAGDLEAPTIKHLGGRIWALFTPYRPQLILTAVLVIVAGALGVAVPLLTQRAFDEALFPPGRGVDLPHLTYLVMLMAAVTVVTALLNIWRTYLTTSFGNRIMADVRERLFGHLQKMELAFFARTKTGAIQSRLANDVGGVAGVLTTTLPSILANVVTVLSALAAMLVLSWQLTVVALILMPLLVFLQLRIGRVRQQIARRTQESLSDMTAITQETLSVSGIMLSKVFNQQQAEVRRYRVENDRQVRLQVRLQMSGQRFFAAVQVFMSITPGLVYLVAGWLLTQDWPITAGTLVAFTTLQARITMPIMSLMRVSLDVQTSLALFARIFEYLDLKPAIEDAPDARPLDPTTAGGRLELADVSFRYPDDDPAVDGMKDDGGALHGISLTIEPGTFTAFVGPSGAGKTTLSYLLPRLYDVTGGSITLDGVPLERITLSSLSDCMGMVTQETYLFHATIAENLRYAKPDATDDELEAAARVANIHDRIMGFGAGYETVVGERGYRLSGGEKQRLAIARVVLKNPPVLILDEATSALDTASERLVQHALESVMAGRTTIAIAHRLSTVTKADTIYVLVEGRIAEYGTHEQLLARGGVYADLYGEQLHTV